MWPDDPLELFVGSGGYDLLERVRLAVTVASTEWSVEAIDDLLLVVDELVANGLDHSQSTVALSCRRVADGDIQVEVSDTGSDLPQIVDAGPDAEHGRGMMLVDTLSRRWGVRREPGGKTVWAVMPARPATPA